jgi:hypothetical protein
MPHHRYRDGPGPSFAPVPARTMSPYRPPKPPIVVVLARLVWAFRVELLIVAILAAAWWQLTKTYPAPAVATLLGGALAVLLVLPLSRRVLVHLLYGAHLRRRWQVACRRVDLATRDDRVPVVRRWRPIPAGDLLRVRIPVGTQVPSQGPWVPNLEDAAERLAVALEVREVRIARDPDNAAHAEVIIVRRDPLAAELQDPWPHLQAARLSLWEDIPVGLDETARW